MLLPARIWHMPVNSRMKTYTMYWQPVLEMEKRFNQSVDFSFIPFAMIGMGCKLRKAGQTMAKFIL